MIIKKYIFRMIIIIPAISFCISCNRNITPTVSPIPTYSPSELAYRYTIKDKKIIIYEYKGSSSDIVIPRKIGGYPVVGIGDSAFQGCNNIKSVVIPDSISQIGDNAFYHCVLLSKVVMPDSITSIGAQAFFMCSSLTDISIPVSVTQIGERAFEDCKSIKNIEIPANITKIEAGTFKGCTSLENVIIPDNVTEIGDSAFQGCTAITDITFPENIKSIGTYAFLSCASLEIVSFSGDAPKFLGNDIFFGTAEKFKIIIKKGTTGWAKNVSSMFINFMNSASSEIDELSESGISKGTSNGNSSSTSEPDGYPWYTTDKPDDPQDLKNYHKFISGLEFRDVNSISAALKKYKQLADSDKKLNDRLFWCFYEFYHDILWRLSDQNEGIINEDMVELYEKNGAEQYGSEAGPFIWKKIGFLYYNFAPTTTDALKEFLNIKNDEDIQTGLTYLIEDALLVISWNDLSDRIIAWEKFIKKYGNNKELVEKAQISIDTYLLTYLNPPYEGMQTFPYMNGETGEDELKLSYERFIKDYATSKYQPLIKGYYVIMVKSGFKINQEAEKYLEKNGIFYDEDSWDED